MMELLILCFPWDSACKAGSYVTVDIIRLGISLPTPSAMMPNRDTEISTATTAAEA